MNKGRSRKNGGRTMDRKQVRSLDGWCGNRVKLDFGSADLDLVDNVLCLVPELRVVASLGQEARRRRIQYPVTSAKQLAACLRGEQLNVEGHRVDAKSIAHALPQEWFPITHEGELLSTIHLAVRRCEEEAPAALLEKLKSQRVNRAKRVRKK